MCISWLSGALVGVRGSDFITTMFMYYYYYYYYYDSLLLLLSLLLSLITISYFGYKAKAAPSLYEQRRAPAALTREPAETIADWLYFIVGIRQPMQRREASVGSRGSGILGTKISSTRIGRPILYMHHHPEGVCIESFVSILVQSQSHKSLQEVVVYRISLPREWPCLVESW